MALEAMTVTWPGDVGNWLPMDVVVEPMEYARRHALYLKLNWDIPRHRRPETGSLVSAAATGYLLAVIFRIAPGPAGEIPTYNCCWYHLIIDPGKSYRDRVVNSRRWFPVTSDRTVLKAETTRDEAIRASLRHLRQAPPPEAEPEGDDLIALQGLV